MDSESCPAVRPHRSSAKNIATMKTTKYSAMAFALAASASQAATMSISLWAYDQAAQNTPYYSHFQVTTDDPEIQSAAVNLLDRGWGYSTTGWSSYHVFTAIDGAGIAPNTIRSIGWHKYEFTFNELTRMATILMDGNTLQSGVYNNDPTTFRFFFHDYYGGIQESVIDDFEYRINGSLVYSQNFDSATLDSGWTPHPSAGTYIASGDTSNPRSGSGALALGATTGGQVANSITFDLTSVPEPTTNMMALCALIGLVMHRARMRE